ncbi:MAG TPA: thiamine pyrophosphate-binding protein, partial [Oligoflexus sp.]|uniref:thiamine pyrophosphate-binding protein n=1 Tax=Oligoflexus sp. TaxID=1971216 RepID=UPI002D4419EE
MNGQSFHEALLDAGYEYFVGVPDSVLSDWIDYATRNEVSGAFQIASQEGEALSLAIGYHLATGKKAVVFLQNSGLGNLINPLMSMAHAQVYRIPVLFIIGWRGAPGIKDEPQHQTMGQATYDILRVCQVESALVQNTEALQKFLQSDLPPLSAILIEAGRLSAKKIPAKVDQPLRIQYLESVLQIAPADAVFFSTTGFTSRELWALQKDKITHPCFYSVGGMGFLNAIGLGFAQFRSDRHTCVLDGDGAFLMHLGNVASIGAKRPQRFLHILLRN